MVLVSVMYPNEPGSSFDQDYYLEKHIPLVRERWGPMGLVGDRLVRGVALGDGSPPLYQVIALFTFHSLPDFQKAAEAHVQELLADVPNFTSVQPIVQISEDLT